ncbi:MAG: hypothetical protein JW726_19785 [Anaerolineales bacterium]|nr:hypothetical protein [Anaerolineales bacterium]
MIPQQVIQRAAHTHRHPCRPGVVVAAGRQHLVVGDEACAFHTELAIVEVPGKPVGGVFQVAGVVAAGAAVVLLVFPSG